MYLMEIIAVAVGLSMDAFAVSVCKGLYGQSKRIRHMIVTGVYFGGFQMLMPLLGYLLGAQGQAFVEQVDHWIAFGLLVCIGANMIFSKEEKAAGETSDNFGWRVMMPLAVATSIDAFAVGISFAFLQVDILRAVCIIGLITFVLSAVGLRIGGMLGEKCGIYAERLGGAVLIFMGCRILFTHL